MGGVGEATKQRILMCTEAFAIYFCCPPHPTPTCVQLGGGGEGGQVDVARQRDAAAVNLRTQPQRGKMWSTQWQTMPN